MPKKRILVTAGLPYANGPIHIGHLVEYIQTDIYVRFLKLIGEDAVYICADDTHGTPVEIKAAEMKMKPEELIAKFHKEHYEDFKKFLIEFDSYYTTNSPENKKFSDYFFNTLNKKGFIYKNKIKITYCPKCKRPLPDRYVRGKCPRCGAEEQYGDACEKCGAKYDTTDLINPKCAVCGTKPELKDSEHYFFKVHSFSDDLKRWLTNNKELQPEIRNYILNWVNEGLKDWDISRDGPYFGFKIPGEKDKYYYVWLDAPIGYISSTENYCKKHKLDALKDYWQNKDTRIIHVIGKDIIYFHFLFWPAMLMGVDFHLPDKMVVHGFLTVNKEKMSKSRGTFLTAKDFLKRYNAEHLRFFYAGMLSEKMADIDLSFDNFHKVVNNELVANISNFCYRTISFANKNKLDVTDFNRKEGIIPQITKKFDEIRKYYNEWNFNKAVSEILEVSSFGNSYFQNSEPWKKEKKEQEEIVSLCMNIAKNIAILLQPILPDISERLLKQLNLKKLGWKDLGFDLRNHRIGKAEILVKKLEFVK